MKHWMLVAAVTGAASLLVGCGGGKEEETESGPSFGSISKKMDAPTGTLDETTAAEVAMAFEGSTGVPTGGSREGLAPVNAQSTEVAGVCDSGTISVDADASGNGTFAYNDCCIATCCIDGSGTVLYDASGSAAYSICATYDMTQACDGVSVDVDFSYCVSATGEMLYSIEVAGDNFVVSGSMSNGNGTLSITGENGTFSCTYTNYSGSCTDSTGGSFSF